MLMFREETVEGKAPSKLNRINAVYIYILYIPSVGDLSRFLVTPEPPSSFVLKLIPSPLAKGAV